MRSTQSPANESSPANQRNEKPRWWKGARSLRRETHLGPQPVAVDQRERPAQLVTDERADDRHARPVLPGADSGAVVGDHEEDLITVAGELDGDRVAAVLERVREQLAEDEREGGGALPRELDGLERRGDLLARDEALDQHRAQPVD